MNHSQLFPRGASLPPEAESVLLAAPSVVMPRNRKELFELALGGPPANDIFEVAYDVPGRGRVLEATVTNCRNGIAVNYQDPYMRRRDPDCLVVADSGPTDKPRFEERFGQPFEPVRTAIMEWLSRQPLVVFAFSAGGTDVGFDALLIAPANAAFFATALADLQGMMAPDEIPPGFAPRAVVYTAPPFRHTVAHGKQVVVHNRLEKVHELYALNLYPGPSAKKGIYGVLLNIGESEGWITAHGATVQVVTPYDNILTIMHEGASGSGKSEMLEYPHRAADGRLLLGTNVVTGERRWLVLTQNCELQPATDDMALCHPGFQNGAKKLAVSDAEQAWFLRVNHIDHYGVDPNYESICVRPPEPLVFLNMHGVPGATCLIWEHTEDAPGKPCPNPRVVLPRRLAPNIVNGPVEVDVRSFGIRAPACTRDKPSYGIAGLLHYLPPALAWLWRLVSPRGESNPSIIGGSGLESEGVGSYWPFATGRRVDQANLLLRQIVATPNTRYTLSPNQHVGAWRTGFMPQWIAREYLARRGGARFRPGQLKPARCALLGYALFFMQVEGTQIPHWLLETDQQPDVGPEAYDKGAAALEQFFHRELTVYLGEVDLDPLARQIIQCCLDCGDVEDYNRLIPLAR